MKRVVVVLALVFSVFMASETAMASTPVIFTSLLTWAAPGQEVGGGFTYNHNILIEGFVPATDTLSSAALNLDITSNKPTLRYVTLTLDSNLSGSYLVSDPAWDTLVVNVSWLQVDGILSVNLANGGGQGTAKLFRSELVVRGDRADATTGAVPEPASMSLLGLGLIGLLGLKKRKA